MKDDYLLRVNKLEFSYGNKKILRGINFKIFKGDKLGIIGESGSGKTSLLKLISGKLDANTGKILFQNKEVKGPSSQLVAGHEQIKLVNQDFDLMPYISVDENILRNALHLSDTSRKKLLRTFHKRFNIKEFKAQKGGEISGGQKQRVALATAMASVPGLLLLDEPFSNLDYSLKQDIINLLISDQSDATRIIVAHEPTDIMALCDKLLVLKKGRIIQKGSVEEVYRNPKNEYVARLLGPANILKPEELKQFGIESNQNAILRPDDFIISDKGVDFSIIDKRFAGGKYTLKCKLKNGTLITLESKKVIPERMKLKLNPDQFK